MKESGVCYCLEGYFFLVIYFIKESIIIESLIDEMLAVMDKILILYYSVIKFKNLIVNELLIIVLFVEKEGVKIEDCKLIVGVFYNCLNFGMLF